MNNPVVKILYYLAENKYEIQSNVREARRKIFLEEVLRSQIGVGRDDAKANEKDVYQIKCEIDLADDSIIIKSDCGNKGLEIGILAELLKRMNE